MVWKSPTIPGAGPFMVGHNQGARQWGSTDLLWIGVERLPDRSDCPQKDIGYPRVLLSLVESA